MGEISDKNIIVHYNYITLHIQRFKLYMNEFDVLFKCIGKILPSQIIYKKNWKTYLYMAP